jgi:hypothetical protein
MIDGNRTSDGRDFPTEVQQLVNDFKERGLVKSIINPKND